MLSGKVISSAIVLYLDPGIIGEGDILSYSSTWTLVLSGKVISSAIVLYLDPGAVREGDIIGYSSIPGPW